jgi:hypothetical protein
MKMRAKNKKAEPLISYLNMPILFLKPYVKSMMSQAIFYGGKL